MLLCKAILDSPKIVVSSRFLVLRSVCFGTISIKRVAGCTTLPNAVISNCITVPLTGAVGDLKDFHWSKLLAALPCGQRFDETEQ